MEIAAQLNATSPSSAVSTKRDSRVASPSERGGAARRSREPRPAGCSPSTRGGAERASPAQHVKKTSLKFTVYNGDKIAVTVLDKESGDIIREIPPEEIQKLSEQMDKMIGRLFDRVA